jgi:hypothetical protein
MPETNELMRDGQKGRLAFENYGVLNMLNTRYLLLGQDAESVILNPAANGNAWFVKQAVKVTSPIEELNYTGKVNTKDSAVVDQSKFSLHDFKYDSGAVIKVTHFDPNTVQYESQSTVDGLGVFSEIYYPKGWHASIDGKEVPILRADYVLRALEIPAGKHAIEFKFEPNAYVMGNKVTTASNWILLLVVLGSIGWSLKEEK